jgi:hypothetical protein
MFATDKVLEASQAGKTAVIDSETAEMGAIWERLDSKSRRFIESRLEGLDLKVAAKAAGLSDQEAKRLDYRPMVKRYIALATRKAVRKTLVTRQDVIEGFMDAVTAASTSTELTQAWREIGRLIGAYEAEKIDVKVSVENLTQEKLLAMSESELIELTQRHGTYQIDTDQDEDAELFENFREALAPPIPVEADP